MGCRVSKKGIENWLYFWQKPRCSLDIIKNCIETFNSTTFSIIHILNNRGKQPCFLCCNTFGSKPIWSPDIRSSASCPPGETNPIKSIPLDKLSPTNSVAKDRWSQTFEPQPIRFSHFLIPTACLPGQRNILGTICLRGPMVGDQIFGDYLSTGTELVEDCLSRGTNKLGTYCGGSNVWGPYAFGTK